LKLIEDQQQLSVIGRTGNHQSQGRFPVGWHRIGEMGGMKPISGRTHEIRYLGRSKLIACCEIDGRFTRGKAQ
jgi:hypothetical protein